MSVFENVRCALLWSKGYKYSFWNMVGRARDLREGAEAILEDINLSERCDAPAGMLSYAEHRALEIGTTIAGGADVIMLDEPTAGMSHAETGYIVGLIRKVSENITLVMVEHDMSVVFWVGRPHFSAGLRRNYRHRNARRAARKSKNSRSLSGYCVGGRTLMLDVQDMHAYYGNSHILQGVKLRVNIGEIVALLGRNGVGRSTTCKAIMGEDPPKGSVRFNGADIAGKPAFEVANIGIGYAPENPDIFPG